MILRAAAFVFGLQAVAAHILLVREYLVVAGGSELALGVFYAAWFLGIFAGSLAAVFRSPREDRLPRTVAALLLLQAILLCAAIPLVRSWRTLAAIPIGTWPSFHALALAGALAALPFGFLTGFLFPALCRLWGRGRPERDASAIGTVYAIESIGSLVGGMLVTFRAGTE